MAICPVNAEGFCERHKVQHEGRLLELSQMDNDVGEKYRAFWDTQTDGIVPTPATTRLLPCPSRGDAIHEADGTARTRLCEACGGTKTRLFVFPCHHPSREPEEVTYQDCRVCPYLPTPPAADARALILENRLSPGDVLVMTAALHSLHRTYPGKFLTAVESPCPAIFEHSPDVVSTERAVELGAERIAMHYPLVNQCNQRSVHFMQGYCDFLSDKLGVNIPLVTNRPHVYLSKKERNWMSQVEEITGKGGKFWLVCAGRKGDYTTKFWGTAAYQDVVDRMRGKVQFVQVGAAEHHHPSLRNVINLVGKTDLRQLIRLAWHSQGGLGGVTFLQHLMAAHEHPYMCVMGGREPVPWNAYPRQHTFHTVGLMPCCRGGGCWRSRVTPAGDGDADKNKSLCEQPIFGDEVLPRCMVMIEPKEVSEKIMCFQP